LKNTFSKQPRSQDGGQNYYDNNLDGVPFPTFDTKSNTKCSLHGTALMQSGTIVLCLFSQQLHGARHIRSLYLYFDAAQAQSTQPANR
jgi:hypothetical protein